MQGKFMFGRIAVALASAALVAGTAQAQQPEPLKVSVTTAETKETASDPAKKICVKEAKMGSRIERKVCRTAEEWAIEQQAREAKGFDPHQRLQ